MTPTEPFTRTAAASRPSVARVLAAVLLLVVGTTAATGGIVGWASLGRPAILEAGPTDPVYLLLATLVVPAVWIVIGAATARWVLRIRPAAVLSVTGRFRWRWYGVCLAVAVLLGGGAAAAQTAISGDTGSPVAGWPILVAIVVLCVPVQAFSEEYVYRGVLLVAIGARAARWTTAVVVPIVATSALFGLVHPRPSIALVAAAVVGALNYATLTHLTGGLEAATAAHTVWNAAALLTVVVVGAAGRLPTVGQVAVGALIEIGLGVVLVVLARRRGVQRVVVDPDASRVRAG